MVVFAPDTYAANNYAYHIFTNGLPINNYGAVLKYVNSDTYKDFTYFENNPYVLFEAMIKEDNLLVTNSIITQNTKDIKLLRMAHFKYYEFTQWIISNYCFRIGKNYTFDFKNISFIFDLMSPRADIYVHSPSSSIYCVSRKEALLYALYCYSLIYNDINISRNILDSAECFVTQFLFNCTMLYGTDEHLKLLTHISRNYEMIDVEYAGNEKVLMFCIENDIDVERCCEIAIARHYNKLVFLCFDNDVVPTIRHLKVAVDSRNSILIRYLILYGISTNELSLFQRIKLFFICW